MDIFRKFPISSQRGNEIIITASGYSYNPGPVRENTSYLIKYNLC